MQLTVTDMINRYSALKYKDARYFAFVAILLDNVSLENCYKNNT